MLTLFLTSSVAFTCLKFFFAIGTSVVEPFDVHVVVSVHQFSAPNILSAVRLLINGKGN